MNMDYEDMGRRIRRLRYGHGWTQEDLAELVDVSTSFIGHIERGSRKASMETLVSIANAFAVSTDYLLAGSLHHSVIGPLPSGLTAGQRSAMQELIRVLYDNLSVFTPNVTVKGA